MISVCVATYNGEKYICQQMQSILCQLGDDDELLVSDDGSKDSTIDLIKNINDPRIKVFANQINIGYVRNFEKLLQLAKGELVFLSDQDDIWHPDKIAAVKQCFADYPDICMVHHRYSLIDGKGQDREGKVEEKAGKHQGFRYLFSEIIKPTPFGSCLAIKKQACPIILPFPSFAYAHDHWAGIVASMNGGVFYSRRSLLKRRIHGNNATPEFGLNVAKKIEKRILFVSMIIVMFFRSIRRT